MEVSIRFTGTKADEEEQVAQLAGIVRAAFGNRAELFTEDGEVVEL